MNREVVPKPATPDEQKLEAGEFRCGACGHIRKDASVCPNCGGVRRHEETSLDDPAVDKL